MDVKIIVSPLVKPDIPSILEIENDSQPEPWTEKAFLEEIDRAGSHFLVARLDTGPQIASDCHSQPIVGYICFWVVADEVQILNVAVRCDLRRRGIARKLIELAIQTGRDRRARFITLEVRESNSPARKLYESFGFKIVGERANYYGEQQENAILMELEITSNFVSW